MVDSIYCAEPMTSGRCVVDQRIQFDRLLLHQLFNNPKKPSQNKKKNKILFYMRMDATEDLCRSTLTSSLCMRMA